MEAENETTDTPTEDDTFATDMLNDCYNLEVNNMLHHNRIPPNGRAPAMMLNPAVFVERIG